MYKYIIYICYVKIVDQKLVNKLFKQFLHNVTVGTNNFIFKIVLNGKKCDG